MKKNLLTFIVFLVSLSFYAQGISVQGIARDDENAAITNKELTFTFQIVKSDNSIIFSEDQTIRTDGFGVFSHIVSTGTADTSGDKVTFSNIDFSEQNMRLKVFVDLGSQTEVYDQPFQYTPYAHYAKAADTAKSADNGVPTGSIMPFLGDTAPEGWVLCNGQSLTSIDGSDPLRAIVGNNAPDLQGMFLRGTGTSTLGSNHVGPNLMSTQTDQIEKHRHGNGDLATDSQGAHHHTIVRLPQDSHGTGNIQSLSSTSGSNEAWSSVTGGGTDTTTEGAHTHDVTGYTSYSSTADGETRPVNYGVNYIIKL
jgi:microcystin-dependent protein